MPGQGAEQPLAKRRLEALNSAPKQERRTAECDWFGAEEVVVLARAAAEGRLAPYYGSCLPAEIFVEYSLEVKRRFKNTCVISLANGELQGYIVTEEAAREGGYEASNALFGAESGGILVDTTLVELEGV